MQFTSLKAHRTDQYMHTNRHYALGLSLHHRGCRQQHPDLFGYIVPHYIAIRHRWPPKPSKFCPCEVTRSRRWASSHLPRPSSRRTAVLFVSQCCRHTPRIVFPYAMLTDVTRYPSNNPSASITINTLAVIFTLVPVSPILHMLFAVPGIALDNAMACRVFRAVILGHIRQHPPTGHPVIFTTAFVDSSESGPSSSNAESKLGGDV